MVDTNQLGKELTTQQIREVQLHMLDEVHKTCQKHKVRYYLSGGTLLGAIRHKGFIPWDDDIDINMPRPDLEKLIRETNGKINDHMFIETLDAPDHYTSFYRIYDLNTILYSSSNVQNQGHYMHVFIDVFPIEGLPKEKWKTVILYKKTYVLMMLAYASYFHYSHKAKGIRKIIWKFLECIGDTKGYRYWNKLNEKIASKYKYEESQYIGVVLTNAKHRNKEKILKKEYEPIIEVKFEDKKYFAPKGYNRYLTNLYGNYMELPKNKKTEHNEYHVWRR